MYILNIESYNHQENSFFFRSEIYNEQKSKQMFFRCIELTDKSYEFTLQSTSNNFIEQNIFVNLVKIFYFKTINDAEKFSQSMNDDTSDYRLLIRKWNSQNNVLSKFYITDQQNNIVKTLTDCEQNICQRFHGQCDSSGCSKVEYAASLKNKKIIPIVSA